MTGAPWRDGDQRGFGFALAVVSAIIVVSIIALFLTAWGLS
jgi:hypothetical protein